MNIQERINNDLTSAMKAKKEPELRTLRLIKAELIKKQKESGAELTDEVALSVLQTLAKKFKDSIDAYMQGGRKDLVEKEQSELAVLTGYLPDQMSEADVRREVGDILDTFTDEQRGNFGEIMKAVMERLKGKADGGVVTKVVKELLAKK